MRSLKTVIGVISALLLVVFFVVAQGPVSERVQGVRAFFKSFTDRAFSYSELVRVRTENEALRAERAILLEVGIPIFSSDLRKVPIYSRYPYGVQGLLTIAAGSDEGISEGMTVLATPGTLLGKVTRVERTRSEVMTTFNPAWRSSVRFEGGNTKALLTGGETPLLTLIPRGKELAEHTRVVNVDPAFPYGLFVGTLGEMSNDEDEPWRSAPLETPYEESDLREALVPINVL
ncbi:MAG: rod shape-determining protein MreC [Candidatus Jorgensenbacteria bacterium]|nr:rod shape-determining protein MreC [Candidatus Jorgensenbacteria bacterium]